MLFSKRDMAAGNYREASRVAIKKTLEKFVRPVPLAKLPWYVASDLLLATNACRS